MSYPIPLRPVVVLVLSLPTCGCGFITGTLVPEDQTYRSLTTADKTRQYSYKLYPGNERNADELAILSMHDVPVANVDGLHVSNTDYQFIQLLPGTHNLSWKKTFPVSVMVESAMEKTAAYTVSAALEAGHRYRLRADRTYGTGYRLYFWIEDEANGAVVAGSTKP